MKNTKQIIALVVTIAGLTGLVGANSAVLAAERCETQYGGGQLCVRTGELQINKQVYDPTNKVWKDNLYVTDYKFSPNNSEYITFKITVKNVGQETFSEVRVKDTLPKYLFSAYNDPLEWKIKDLNPGDEETQSIRVRVVDAKTIKTDTNASVVCDDRTTNVVDAWADSDKEHDKDTSQVCINNTGVVTTLPATGPGNTMMLSILAFVAGIAGLAFAKVRKAIALG